MSRHRDIRNMDYSDDYHGYDDIYGHSIDDDYYISPSNRQFIYNRENARDQPKIGEYLKLENDIHEEEEFDISQLSDMDRAKLESCIDQITTTLGPTNISKKDIIKSIISNDYNIELALSSILDNSDVQEDKKEKVGPPPVTIIPAENDYPAIKTVSTSTKLSTNVTKGFDINPKDSLKSNSTPRSQSPMSGRGTPTISHNIETDESKTSSRNKETKPNIETIYNKERKDNKEHLYMVVIGHVDAGKSTLMGHLLCALGQINQRTMHKYEQESRKLGKQSFMYAWVLDETGEERNRGITMDVARRQFDTKTKLVTLLDAPGHKDFIPSMISGASQADVALLVVDATRGEFETGFDYGGQTREHALLVRSLGVTQLAVAINKLDTVSWSKERFDEIVQKLKMFLRQAGFKENDVSFIPCSGLTGQNLIGKPTENELLSWYSGPCLLDVMDNFRPPERPITKPFRMSVNDIFKGTGSGFCVSGRIETGSLAVGDKILVCPNKETAIVKSIAIEDLPQQTVFAGDQAVVTLSGIEMQNLSVGNILCDIQNPVQVATKFQARIVIFNVEFPVTRGFSVVLHHQSLVEPAIISKLISQLNKNTGELIKKHPRFLSNNTSGIVEIQTSRSIALELYSDCKELGRFMLRVGGVTIAAGLISKIVN